MRAAVYCRVSTEEQAREGFSIGAQEKALLSFAESMGYTVVNIYKDEGISGHSTNRPMFKVLLQDASKGLFDIILVWKINRFSRKNSDLLSTVEHLEKYHVSLVSLTEQFDTSTPSGKLLLSMLGSIGEFERDTILENIKAGMAERACRGLFNGGRVLGYDSENGKLVINEHEAFTVRRIFKLYLDGSTLSDIKNKLTLEGLKTKNCCTFDISSIRRILKNPLYAGYIYYNRMGKSPILVQGTQLPIISKEDFETASYLLNSKHNSHIHFNRHLLSGLLVCPVCGSRMICHGGKYRYYVCTTYKHLGPSACRSHYVNACDMESKVTGYLFKLISSPMIAHDVYNKILENRNLYDQYEKERLNKELSIKRRALDRLFRMLEYDNTDCSEIKLRAEKLTLEIQNIKCCIEKLNAAPINTGLLSYETVSKSLNNFGCLFNCLDSELQKKFLRCIINKIYITEDGEISTITLTTGNLPINGMRYTDNHV